MLLIRSNSDISGIKSVKLIGKQVKSQAYAVVMWYNILILISVC